MPATVTPGQVIGNTSSHIAGAGTHVYEQNIFASIAGPLLTITAKKGTDKTTISISHASTRSYSSYEQSNALPSVGSAVLCRITRVQQRQLTASILVTNPNTSDVISFASTTDDELQFQAILRKEDVRAFEKDKLNMNESFRVGDIIRAAIISLGDERSYYISTAGDDYGIVIAKSDAGNAMVPASWREMVDLVTGKRETRKVAKPG